MRRNDHGNSGQAQQNQTPKSFKSGSNIKKGNDSSTPKTCMENQNKIENFHQYIEYGNFNQR